jgi:hypothetical protein
VSQLRRLRAIDAKLRRHHRRARLQLLRQLVGVVPVYLELQHQQFNRIRRLAEHLEVSPDVVVAECLRVGLPSVERNAAEDIKGPPASGPRLKHV